MRKTREYEVRGELDRGKVEARPRDDIYGVKISKHGQIYHPIVMIY